MKTLLLVGAGATLLAIGVAVTVTGGCIKSTEFHCTADNECTNAMFQGRCEPDNLCSFPDRDCDSGYRYGENNGATSGDCVGVPQMIDARIIDGPPDMFMPDARECFGSGSYQLCFMAMPPMGSVSLTGALDTANDPRCVGLPASWGTAGQPDSCLIMGHDVSVTGTLTVTGARPLVIVGDSVSIGGTIDIASHRTGMAGAGANSALCTAFPTAATDNSAGAGAGAGGTFMTVGGNGGRGTTTGVTGGTAPAVGAAPTLLRGGCPGQTGGTGTQAAGAPGAGGGALFIAAGTLSFTSSGVINASGAAGSGGGTFSGGSGGGAGGMIVIHAAQLGSLTGGKLVANGGGGASGGDNGTGGTGGSETNIATITTPAAGGPSGGGGASGGAGFAGTTAAATGNGSNGKGGGGGGGGGGYIQSNVALTGIAASPAITVVP